MTFDPVRNGIIGGVKSPLHDFSKIHIKINQKMQKNQFPQPNRAGPMFLNKWYHTIRTKSRKSKDMKTFYDVQRHQKPLGDPCEPLRTSSLP